ncbi:MAG: response regulator transcription factor [Desulfobacterales bacterium]|nr:response regulator transcription factor [Desulfobacterales bacterium]MCP4158616.1 response regulator transcription factor [Deltaproteobacteria bacterium]
MENTNLRILIVEDNRDLAENIGDYLETKGHIIDFAHDGIGGLHLALTEIYDIIILDIMMPGMDGLSVCRKLREEANNNTPVLMLTARDTLDDKLKGFDSGADDYLVKPFALQELYARVKVLAKREVKKREITLSVSDLTLEPGSLKVFRSGLQIELNKICLNILKVLMEASPNVVKRKDLEHSLWGDMPPGSDALRSHLYTLRQKIDKPFEKNLIHTIHGVGYKIYSED